VTRVRDYLKGEITDIVTGEKSPSGLPVSDVIFFELEDKSNVIVRPSGTEPKIKIYYLMNGKDKEETQSKIAAYKETMAAMIK